MRKGRQTGSSCAARPVAAALAAWSIGCEAPKVGERVTTGAVEGPGPAVVLEEAALDLHGHAVATFRVTQGDRPLALDEALALAPRFTLATLRAHPVDGYPAWESLLLTGAPVATS